MTLLEFEKQSKQILTYTFLSIYMGGGRMAKFNLAINSPDWKLLVKVSDQDTVYGYN